jgi:membrane-associated phospholipid phosphatase
MVLGMYVLEPPAVGREPFDGRGGQARNPTFDTISDVTLVSGLSLAALGSFAVERWGEGRTGWQLARGPLILAEAVFLTLGVVSLAKNLGECRPRAWDDATRTCVGSTPGSPVREDRVSFPSGHTSPLAAMAGASLGLWLLPERRAWAWAPVALGAGLLAGAMLVFRVVAGAHNWVDTGTGFALGLGLGFATAALHTRRGDDPVGVTVSPVSIALGGRF